MKSAKIYSGNQHIVYDTDVFGNAKDISFDSKVLRDRDVVFGSAKGRGRTLFFRVSGYDLVLRHYQRGGIMAGFMGDRYFWKGLEQARPYCEWQLLKTMYSLGLPVPRPAAYRVIRTGFTYRADIILHHLASTETLAELLKIERLPEGTWRAIGKFIKKFHNRGIFHADLNAHNILQNSSGRLYLIDFDKGRICYPRRSWQRSNLLRLQRSLKKLSCLYDIFNFSDGDWQCLLEGYNQNELRFKAGHKRINSSK